MTTYTLSAKLNRETNTYKDAYLIGATRNTHLAHSTYTYFYHALGFVWDEVE